MPRWGLRKYLIENSVDAFVLSLETINRLSVKYRIEAFVILLCNAWELLLKAKIIDKEGKGAIYYPKERGKQRRTLSATDCMKNLFPNERDSTRQNLIRVIELRDESVHLVIASVPADVMELLQACVLNYHKCLQDWFSISISDRVPVGLMTIVYDLAPLRSEMPMLKKQMGAAEIKFLTKFQGDIRSEAAELGHAREFIARIEHNVVVRNRPGQADVQLIGGTGAPQVHVIEKPRDPALTHPFYEADAMVDIRVKCPSLQSLNTFSFQAICHDMRVRTHPEWYFKLGLPRSRSQYSPGLTTEVASRISRDSEYVNRARRQYTQWKREQGHYGHRAVEITPDVESIAGEG